MADNQANGGNRSTLTQEWAETLEIMSDREFMRDVEQGLAEIDRGERLYTFEDIFGESPEAAAR